MSPERFRQIEELYHAVREGTVEQRAALLLGIDPELRREVELLLAQRTAGKLLDRPPSGTFLDSSRIRLSPGWMRALAWGPTVSKAS
jgi:hypothetical protein